MDSTDSLGRLLAALPWAALLVGALWAWTCAATESLMLFVLRQPLRAGVPARYRTAAEWLTPSATQPWPFLRSLLGGRVFGMAMAAAATVWLLLPGASAVPLPGWALRAAAALSLGISLLAVFDLLPRGLARWQPAAATGVLRRLLPLVLPVGAWVGRRIARTAASGRHSGNRLPGAVGYAYPLRHLLDEAAETQGIDREVIHKALDFNTTRVREFMIPRTEIIAVPVETTLAHLQARFVETEHSRILVYQHSLDHLLGFVHCNALFERPSSVREVLQPLLVVPDSMPAALLLNQFQKTHKPMAIVVDEFGGTSGLVTVEDLVEVVFGEIEDEHDEPGDEDLVEQPLGTGSWRFSARLEIAYLNEAYPLHLPEGDYSTLGGLVLHLAERIPDVGEVFATDNVRLTVLQAARNKLLLVQADLLRPTTG